MPIVVVLLLSGLVVGLAVWDSVVLVQQISAADAEAAAVASNAAYSAPPGGKAAAHLAENAIIPPRASALETVDG